MQIELKRFKEKKFVQQPIRICITCGSDQTTSNQYTLYCKNCGALNFYEVT